MVFTVIFSLLYMPILKKLGVQNKILMRSTTVGAINAGAQVAPGMVAGIFAGGMMTNLVSPIGLLFSSYITGRYLQKALIIKPWHAYGIAFGVSLGGSILLAFLLLLAFK